MTTRPAKRRRPPTIPKTALGAYLVPAVSTFLNARLIDKADLAFAAWTTIGTPSAVAAVGATLLARRVTPPNISEGGANHSTSKYMVRAALFWAIAAAAVAGWLVGNGWANPVVFTQMPVSAAMGAAIATRKVLRSKRSTAPSGPSLRRIETRNGVPS